jgi:hypothetical protein
VGPGVAVRITVAVPVYVTVPEQLAVLPVTQLMGGVVWLVTTEPVAVPPPDRALTVIVAVAAIAGPAASRPTNSATCLSTAPFMVSPSPAVKLENSGGSESKTGTTDAVGAVLPVRPRLECSGTRRDRKGCANSHTGCVKNHTYTLLWRLLRVVISIC